MKEKNNIAILLFARSGKEECQHKTWFEGKPKHNAQLSSWLTQHTKQQLAKSGLPVFHFSEKEQEGTSFGQRLSKAFHHLFAAGYKSVIAVGNDSPDLANLPWSCIIQSLNDGNNVLGPNLRGGAYLIGLHANSFNAKAFEELAWQSKQLQTELLHFCGAKCRLLKPLRDLNTARDLASFYRETDLSALKRLISLLQQRISPNSNYSENGVLSYKLMAVLSNRPPPLLFSTQA